MTAADAGATSEMLSRTRKFFLQKRLSQKGYPFSGGRNRFWTGFCQRGQKQFSESKSPPYRGSHLPHAHSSSFEMRRTEPVPTRGVRDDFRAFSRWRCKSRG